MVTRPQIRKLSFTIKKAAIKNNVDGIKTLIVERRSIGRQIGDGTMNVDVDAELATKDQAKTKSSHMKRKALTELQQKATEELEHTGETSKARPPTCGLARGRREGYRATTSPPARMMTQRMTVMAANHVHLCVQVALTRMRPTRTVPILKTERFLLDLIPSSHDGRAALGAGDALAMVMRERIFSSAPVAEKRTAVDVEARRVLEAAAERRSAEEAAKADSQMDLEERRPSVEEAVTERSVAGEETNSFVAAKRVNLEARLARVEVYKMQLDIFGQMYAAAPSTELVSADQDATQAFNRPGGASMSTGGLGGGGQQ